MNGVAVIDRVTIDCIFSGMAGFPGAGEELYTDRFSMTLGGGACVTPVRLGNMGVPVRYGTFLGQGLLSKTAETLLQKYKVQNLHNFYDGDGEPVIFSSVFSFPSDRSIMTFDAGLGENLLTDAQVYDFLHGADVCFAPRRPDVVKKLAREGTKIVYDTHWEEGQTLEDHLPILRLADFFTPNDKEAMLLTGTDSPQAALDALCNYTAQPIVKVGKDGCITRIHGKTEHFPAGEATPVDKTGAGDNFLAGLVFGVYHGCSVAECIQLANISGGKSTETFGCYDAPYDLRTELKALRREG